MASGWHIEKGIPIALIVAIVLQTATAIWWASGVNTRLMQVEATLEARARQESRLVAVEVGIRGIEGNVQEMRTDIREIRAALERLIGPRQ